MTTPATTIRPTRPEDKTEWRALWNDYCAFYEQTVPKATTETLWTRLHDASFPIYGLIAVGEDGALIGLTHYVLHPHTWSDKTLCYLEDLFVSPAARGKGTATALIEHLVAEGRTQGWKRVYWHTNRENTPAQRVYDRFTPADDFVRYNLDL